MLKVVILGAGFGGLQAALGLEPLAARGDVQVTLIDRAPAFQMGFAMQWALHGRRGPEAGRRAYPPASLPHTRFVSARATAIDLEGRAVVTDEGGHPFDRLVIATGAELSMDHVEGLAYGAFNLYSMDSVLRLKEELHKLQRGRVVISITGTPYKCPPAPFEYAFLIDDILRSRRVHSALEVAVTSPEAQPMTVAGPEVGAALAELMANSDISFFPNHRLERVDEGRKEAHFEGGAVLPYSLLAAIPRHRAPEVVRACGLADASGFVPVELGSFRTKVDGVFAVGDVAGVRLPGGSPHPKAGVFAELQGAAVASQIDAEVQGGKPAPYLGHGVCFIDMGGGQAALADANLLAEGGPRFRLDPPGAGALDAKTQFEVERLRRWFGAE